MTHLQHPAVLVLGVDIPSHFADERSEDLRPQTHALLHRWAEHKRGPAWIRVNLLTGTCHPLWLIDYVYVAASSASTRLLAVTKR